MLEDVFQMKSEYYVSPDHCASSCLVNVLIVQFVL